MFYRLKYWLFRTKEKPVKTALFLTILFLATLPARAEEAKNAQIAIIEANKWVDDVVPEHARTVQSGCNPSSRLETDPKDGGTVLRLTFPCISPEK